MRTSIKPQKRTILNEDDYQATLSDIISRDYFPEVDELKKQLETQHRRKTGNIPRGVHLKRSYQSIESIERDEECTAVVDSGDSSVTRAPLHLESLSGFHARFTSEDNASFDQVQNEELKHQAKIAVLCNAPAFLEKRVRPAIRSSSLVMSPLPLASDHFDPPSNHCSITEFERESNNYFFFVPEARQNSDRQMLAIAAPSDISVTRGDDRSIISVQTTSMPPPINRASNKDLLLVGYISNKKCASQKEIVPSATRFPSRGFAQRPAPSNNWDVESQTDYWSSTDDGSEVTDLNSSSGLSLDVQRLQAVKKRNRDSSKLVRMTPLIVPGTRGTEDSSPLVTWGAVAGTPLVVSNLDTPTPPSFQLPQMSARDDAAAKAHEMLCRKLKGQQNSAVRSAQSSMTHMGINSSVIKARPISARAGKSLGSALRKSYLRTPKSARRESTSHPKTASTDTAYRLTPQLPRKLK